MKKFFMLFAVFTALIFVVSCGGSSKKEDKTDTGDTVSDEGAVDTDQTDTEPAGDAEPTDDTEPADTTPDDTEPTGDTTPESNDDDADTAPKPDDDADTAAPEYKPVFPECSESQTFPCYDSEYKIYWSGKTTADSVEDAVSYCKNSIIEGYTGWYMPTISELRTLVRNCDKIAPNGTCPIVDENSMMESFEECKCSDSENYSRFGDTEWLLSATQRDSEHAWGLDFGSGKIEEDRDLGGTIRCAATNLNSECTDDICLNVEYSRGICSNDALFKGKIACSCKSGYEWNGSFCEGPCAPNLCKNMAHSTGICSIFEGSEFGCGCRSGYFWNGSECKKPIYSLGNICTGQDSCYANQDDHGKSITCPSSPEDDYFGQDAYYAAEGVCIPHNFINKWMGASVVIDDNTGLMWEYRGGGENTWSEAVEYCANLEYPELSGWRLPTPLEMLTIIHNGYYLGYYMDNFDIMERNFWTSKEYPQDQTQAYYVNFDHHGLVRFDSKTEKKARLCVRGMELLKSTFIQKTVNGDSVVLDSTTGLMWQGRLDSRDGWINALKYCENLIYAGYSDWRLPNKNEIASLLNYDKSEAPFSDFADIPTGTFWWTSTVDMFTSGMGPLYPALVDFERGTITANNYSVQEHFLCVRNN